MTPSLWPLESRPFLVLPAPFLWADSIVNGNGETERGDLLGRRREEGPNSPLKKDDEELELNDIPLKEAIKLKLIEVVTAIVGGVWSCKIGVKLECFSSKEMEVVKMRKRVILPYLWLFVALTPKAQAVLREARLCMGYYGNYNLQVKCHSCAYWPNYRVYLRLCTWCVLHIRFSDYNLNKTMWSW